jgi:hypothetical protein
MKSIESNFIFKKKNQFTEIFQRWEVKSIYFRNQITSIEYSSNHKNEICVTKINSQSEKNYTCCKNEQLETWQPDHTLVFMLVC